MCRKSAKIKGDVENVATNIINQFVPEVISPNHQSNPKKPRSLSNQTRPGDPPEMTTATNATGSSLKGKPVLLQTAQCVAVNADTMRSTTVRVLFDTGSQRMYITNSLKSQLGLKPIERESLRLSTFGNDRVRKESCDIVKSTKGRR